MSLLLSIFFTSPSIKVEAATPFGTEIAANTKTVSTSFDLNNTDTSKAQKTVTYYLYMFGGSIIAFAMGLAALRMILTRNSETKREETMTTLGKIILGCSLLGSCILLSGFLIGVANNVGSVLTKGTSGVINSPTTTITDDDGNFVVKAFANIFTAIEKCIFNLFNTYFGFLPLDQLIFNSKANVFGVTGTVSTPPFTDSEWSNLNYMYLRVASICAPLVLIMIGKTAISVIMSANKPAQRSQFQEDACRWLFSLMLIALGPILLKGLFLFSSDMTDAVVSMFNASLGKDNYVSNVSLVDSITTGSALTSAIVKCLFAWKYFQINMLFLVRKIVLTAMYAFTPLAALFWGIDNKTQAIQIWFGEMITNATMQFFYAFTFSIMIISLSGSSWKNWFYALVWIFTLVKLAEVFRNSLQGLFTKLAGVDEMSIAGKSFGPISAAASGAVGAISRTFKGSGISKLSNGLNMGGLKNSALGAAVFAGAGGSKKYNNGGNNASPSSTSGTTSPLDGNSVKRAAQGAGAFTDPTAKQDGTEANMPDSNNIKGNPMAAKSLGNNDKENDNKNFEINSTPGAYQDYNDPSIGSSINEGNSKMASGNPHFGEENQYESSTLGENPETENIKGNGNLGDNSEITSEIPHFAEENPYESSTLEGNPETANVGGNSSDGSNDGATSGSAAGEYAADDPIVNAEKFKGVDPLKPVTDKNGNVNMNNLRAASSRHMLYSSMLNDNLKKFAANRPASAKVLGGISRAANFKNETMANRVIAGKAINATVSDMQSLAGGKDKLSRKDALTQLFGGSKPSAQDRTKQVLSGNINTLNINNDSDDTVSRNMHNFKSAISRGDTGRASQIVAGASPMNNLSLKQRSAVIAKTNPYTNIDGFRW